MTSSRPNHLGLYVLAIVSVCIVAALTVLAAKGLDVHIKILTRDPYRAGKMPWHFAYVSLFTSTLWLIAGAATSMTAVIGWRAFGCRFNTLGIYRLVWMGGVVGLVMALDDILLFHDAWARALGIPELLFHGVYFAGVVAIVVWGRRDFLRTPWLLFLGAVGCFGASSVIDLLVFLPDVLRQYEDVFKTAGVILWGYYFLGVSLAFVSERAREGRS